MNYPIWNVPASGLLIAAIAIVHVFISHFAIGGGLFLVFYEWKARRDQDAELLGYVRQHSRFFLLLTLVLGAVTGVGIWFTIGLVQPQATSTLIQLFVWVWAIEWTFFVTEIAAAMIYYYGWDRLEPSTHLAVGVIYFAAAWLSLVAINGILAFMLTPGDWITSRSLVDAFLNPTYWPSLLGRTLVAVGLAGIYALFTASFLERSPLKQKVARVASAAWVTPAALLLPISVLWYFAAAAAAGVQVGEVLGTQGQSIWLALQSLLFSTPQSGYPPAQTAVLVCFYSSVLLVLLTALVFFSRARLLRPVLAAPIMLLGLLAFGGAEWVREDLRKPFVIGRLIFVNSVRLPSPQAVRDRYPEVELIHRDPFSVETLNRAGVLKSSYWLSSSSLPGTSARDSQIARGGEIFRALCTACHTPDGHLAIRPLLGKQSPAAIEGILSKLARPVSKGTEPVSWFSPKLQLQTWRGRRMPPFVGTGEEKEALAVYLASLAGTIGQSAEDASLPGRAVFEKRCIFCHGSEADWPMARVAPRLSRAEFYERIGRLSELNPVMPPFDGTDEEREALAEYLEVIASKASSDSEEQK